MSRTAATDRHAIHSDTPLRLADAVEIAFPSGGMTVSGLRREIARGRLEAELIAGKHFVTLAAIQQMRQLCRVRVDSSGADRATCSRAAGSDRGAVRGAPRLPQVRQAAGRISDRAQADLRLYGRPEQSAELPVTTRLGGRTASICAGRSVRLDRRE